MITHPMPNLDTGCLNVDSEIASSRNPSMDNIQPMLLSPQFTGCLNAHLRHVFALHSQHGSLYQP